MFEHPSLTYNALAVEQERVDRANELRRIIAENPSRVTRRENRALARVRGWFGSRPEDAAAHAAARHAAASGDARVPCDQAARPAHAG